MQPSFLRKGWLDPCLSDESDTMALTLDCLDATESRADTESVRIGSHRSNRSSPRAGGHGNATEEEEGSPVQGA